MMRQAFKRIRFLLNARERIAGISFTDDALFCALTDKADIAKEGIFNVRELPRNVIVDSKVLDHEVLATQLEQALRALHTQVSFANLSLPSALFFSTILHIPRTNDLHSDHRETVKLLLDVELPWKQADAYTDHLIIPSGKDLSVSIFSILRSSADPYILAAERAGVEVLALECDASSTRRIMETSPKNIISLTATSTHASIIVAKNAAVRFMLTLPLAKVKDEESLQREVVNVRHYFTEEVGEPVDEGIEKGAITENATTFLGSHAGDINYYPSAGAALRDPNPAPSAREISLLPLRSDELYNLHRIASGLQLLRQATIVTCLILIGAHFLLLYILDAVSKQSTERATSAPHLYANIADIDRSTKALNDALLVAEDIAAHTQRYGPTLATIDNIATEGININSISVSSAAPTVTISGVAATRSQYNFFRTSVAVSDKFDVISFPLGNLDLTMNIPFTLTVSVKHMPQ